MKQNYVLLSTVVAAIGSSQLAAQPAPVIEVSTPAYNTPITNGQPSSNIQVNNAQLGNIPSGNVPSGSVTEQLASISRQLDARNRAQIKIHQQLTDLQNEVDELRGVTELHSHKLGQIIDRQRELYQELDRRVSQAIQAPAAPAALTPSSNGLMTKIDYSNDLPENQAYDQAVNLVLKQKKYDEAIVKFKSFNQKYPNSSYSANAHYWLGQLLFTKSELEQASAEFSIVVNQHKSSSKRGDAMLKLAMVAHKQNNTAKAVSLYQQLIREYPASSAAKLAAPRLESLK